MIIDIDSKGQRFRERLLLLRDLRTTVCKQIQFWNFINSLEELVNPDFDAQLWAETAANRVASGAELTLPDVNDFLNKNRIHIVSDSPHLPISNVLLRELGMAVDLQIAFWKALHRLEHLKRVDFDPEIWIRSTTSIVDEGADLTMADVDDFLGCPGTAPNHDCRRN